MKTEIQLPVSELKMALTGFGKIVSRSSLPILGCLKVECDKFGVMLKATNLDDYATYRLPNNIKGNVGSFLVPFETLTKIVKKSSKEAMVALLYDGKETTLRTFIGSRPVDQKVETPDIKEWPETPFTSYSPFPVDASFKPTLKEAFECASTDASRHVLNSVYLDVSDANGDYMVSTSGRVLFSANSFTFGVPESVIIPSRKFLGWNGFLEDAHCSLATQKVKNALWVQLETEHWTFITRQIEGPYPNWKQVVPASEPKAKILLSSKALDCMLEVLPKLPGADDPDSPVGLICDGKALSVHGCNRDGQQKVTIEIPDVTVQGAPIKLRVNRNLLLPALRFGLTEMHLFDELGAFLMIKGGKKMVIMPLRPDATKPAPKPAEPTPPVEAINPEPTTQPNESTVMTKTTENTPETTNADSAIKTVLQQIEKIKETLKGVINDFGDVMVALKTAEREKKASDKEVEAIRASLRAIQNVKI